MVPQMAQQDFQVTGALCVLGMLYVAAVRAERAVVLLLCALGMLWRGPCCFAC